MFTQDFKELLSAFNEHRVKYLIIGGYADAIRKAADSQQPKPSKRNPPEPTGPNY
jgi:hypothetical protein